MLSINQLKALDPNTTTKGCITAIVICIDAEKSGNKKDKTPWRRQTVRVTDGESEINLGVWDGNIGKLELNKTYEICNFQIGQYKGNNTANIHADTTIKEIQVEKTKPSSNSQSYNSTKTEYTKIKGIEDDLKKIEPDIEKNPQRLGMYMKLIHSSLMNTTKES